MLNIAWQFENITRWFGCETYDEFVEKHSYIFGKFGFNGVFFDDVYKWYDYEKDMIELSKRFPKYLFILEGHGEDYHDVWRHYFLNGKEQFAYVQMIFDECKLR